MAITSDDLVRREVHYCVSGLVHTLAQGYGCTPGRTADHAAIGELCEQAMELATPIADYESAAREAGFDIRHDMHGFYSCTLEEAEHEDDGNPSAGFDGREHFSTVEDAARDACEIDDIEPHEREVYEHWIVSDWLADKLAEKGERVDKDFAGMTVWARTTTGQAISIDSVIEEITADVNNA